MNNNISDDHYADGGDKCGGGGSTYAWDNFSFIYLINHFILRFI